MEVEQDLFLFDAFTSLNLDVADSAITTGVASIILFNRSFFTSDSKKTSPAKPEEAAVDPTGQDQ